jgi:hypothetical protein
MTVIKLTLLRSATLDLNRLMYVSENSILINRLQPVTGNLDSLTLRRLMSCIYGAPILDASRSHTTTQHIR